MCKPHEKFKIDAWKRSWSAVIENLRCNDSTTNFHQLPTLDKIYSHQLPSRNYVNTIFSWKLKSANHKNRTYKVLKCAFFLTKTKVLLVYMWETRDCFYLFLRVPFGTHNYRFCKLFTRRARARRAFIPVLTLFRFYGAPLRLVRALTKWNFTKRILRAHNTFRRWALPYYPADKRVSFASTSFSGVVHTNLAFALVLSTLSAV